MRDAPWTGHVVSPDGTHYVDSGGRPVYARRFQQVHAFHPPGFAPVRELGRAFHIHGDGTDAYLRRFDLAFGFYEGLAAVRDAAGWFHIFPTGEPAYESRWQWAGNFQQSRSVVQGQDGAFSHIDRGGMSRTGPWAYAGDFSEGTAAVQQLGGLCRHIDRSGSFLHGNELLDLLPFHKGFAVARDAAGWLHVDLHGRPLYSQRYSHLEPFYNGLALATRPDESKVRVDPSGQENPLPQDLGQQGRKQALRMNPTSQRLVARRGS